ncbi:hypothetical protein B0I35DRAFT_409522 [Stachybotrys elegans]|uniref:Aminoglycoside phosphotransferase domain-containing protein n=1 Tax=Stachybotrys elegans TaxID=80388 RepID=A0A8K0WR00_9HYPO|nr:hypothetical protein B0I35DRAFT_409522 [Stachybotrys elegans]
MSWSKYLPADRVQWTLGYDSYPVWPSEPDLAAIKGMFVSQLPGENSEHLDISIRYLADGAHHKIYEATHSSWPTAYLLRIAVPLDPCLKMESEMATLEYLRCQTTLPVARPIAWSSTVDERLGYEWCLVEKIPGVELREVWRLVPWEKKVDIVKSMATFMSQLWDPATKFPQIGSIYLSTTLQQQQQQQQSHGHSKPGRPASNVSPRRVTMDESQQVGFFIGPAVDGAFFTGRRRYLKSIRGPYGCCHDWLKALIKMEQEFLRSAKFLLESRSQAPAKYQESETSADMIYQDIEVDEDFLDNYDSMMENCQAYLRILPQLFSKTENSDHHRRYALHHCDLRSANILVDRESFDITGIIDWEQTMFLKTRSPPFLRPMMKHQRPITGYKWLAATDGTIGCYGRNSTIGSWS